MTVASHVTNRGSLVAQYERFGEDIVSCTTIDAPTRALLGEVTARAFTLAGVGPRDIVQVTRTIDVSGAAWPALWALDQLDAVVVATSGLRATPALRQLEFLRAFGASTLCADEDVLDALDATARIEGYPLTALSVRRILLTTPALMSARRREIEDTWNASVFAVYPSRSASAWAGAECDASRRAGGSLGLHVWDDAVIVEVVDATGSPCATGETGEVVETCRVDPSAPVVRLRTGRHGQLLAGACSCGLAARRVTFVEQKG